MEAAPASPFEMPESHLLLELLIVALDAPAQLGQIDQAVAGDLFRQRREPVFDRFFIALWPLDEEPFFGAAPVTAIWLLVAPCVMSMTLLMSALSLPYVS